MKPVFQTYHSTTSASAIMLQARPLPLNHLPHEPSRSSYQRILLIGPLALALARRYNWSRAAL